MSVRVGVDIGGTFTDFCIFDEDTNALRSLKVLSTPDRPGEEIVMGLQELSTRYGNRGKRPGGQAAARWRMRSGKGRMGGAAGMSSRLPR